MVTADSSLQYEITCVGKKFPSKKESKITLILKWGKEEYIVITTGVVKVEDKFPASIQPFKVNWYMWLIK